MKWHLEPSLFLQRRKICLNEQKMSGNLFFQGLYLCLSLHTNFLQRGILILLLLTNVVNNQVFQIIISERYFLFILQWLLISKYLTFTTGMIHFFACSSLMRLLRCFFLRDLILWGGPLLRRSWRRPSQNLHLSRVTFNQLQMMFVI